MALYVLVYGLICPYRKKPSPSRYGKPVHPETNCVVLPQERDHGVVYGLEGGMRTLSASVLGRPMVGFV